ncbi:hypothetical protein [Halorubrum trueperi]|uniref:Uncharacterized protein n=1 Tax=Halorubrum trueperi TaxID=2004704 RepID=A0ABD5UTQ4_9EURY
MALLTALREAPRPLHEQPILSVPMTSVAVLQPSQLFVATLEPVSSLVGTDEESSRSDATTADRCSNEFNIFHLSH